MTTASIIKCCFTQLIPCSFLSIKHILYPGLVGIYKYRGHHYQLLGSRVGKKCGKVGFFRCEYRCFSPLETGKTFKSLFHYFHFYLVMYKAYSVDLAFDYFKLK